ADDVELATVLAMFGGKDGGQGDGLEFLVDAAGTLRAVWAPGGKPDWRDADVMDARSRLFATLRPRPGGPDRTSTGASMGPVYGRQAHGTRRRHAPPSPGAEAWMASAWTPPASSPASVSLIMRWRSSRLFPRNASATIYTLKWVSPPSRCPACPTCWWDSSTTSRLAGAKALASFSAMRSRLAIASA